MRTDVLPRGLKAILLVVILGALFFAGRAVGAAGTIEDQAWVHTSLLPTFDPQADHLYVASTAGNEEARSFVRVDLEDRDRSSALVLETADDGLLADRALIRACLLAEPLEESGQIDAPGPPIDCSLSVPVERVDATHWRVNLDLFVIEWGESGNTGLALLPNVEDAAATFRISFDAEQTTVRPGEPSPSTSSSLPSGEDTAPLPPVTQQPSPDGQAPGSITTTLGELPPSNSVPAPPEPVVPSDSPTDDIGLEADGAALAAVGNSGAFSPSPLFAVLAFLVSAGAYLVAQRMFVPLLVSAGGPGLAAGNRIHRRFAQLAIGRRRSDLVRVLAIGLVVGLSLWPMVASDATVFRATLVLVYVVAVFGLHVVVNWAGELSLAHASLVAVPAFSVLSLSAVHGVSPLLLLPLAVAVGLAMGVVVALPALKVRGVQVAIVTLAAGVAVNQFLLGQAWLVGPLEGYASATPSIGPVELTSERAIYVVVLFLTLLALALGWALLHSRIARAMFWVRDYPDAASAFGISVVRYRITAFAIAGAYAGLAGGLMVTAMGRLTPSSFPVTLSILYLVPVILAGPGYAGGLVFAAVILQGGPIFAGGADDALRYLGPLALILVITRYRAGLHGAGRSLMERVDGGQVASSGGVRRLRGDLVTSVAVGSMVAGLAAIAVAWYRTGNTDQTWIQNQELLSGGLGGIALVIIGSSVYATERVVRSHRALAASLRTADDASTERDGESDAAVAGPAARGGGSGERPLIAATAEHGTDAAFVGPAARGRGTGERPLVAGAGT